MLKNDTISHLFEQVPYDEAFRSGLVGWLRIEAEPDVSGLKHSK